MALGARKVSEAFEKRVAGQGILPGSPNVFVVNRLRDTLHPPPPYAPSGGGDGGEVTAESCNIFFIIFKL